MPAVDSQREPVARGALIASSARSRSAGRVARRRGAPGRRLPAAAILRGGISNATGATKVPCAASPASGARAMSEARRWSPAMCSSSAIFASSSMTGPTSVVRARRVADSRAHPSRRRASRARAAPLSCCTQEDAQRRAALARAVERRNASRSVTTCSGSAEESIDHRVQAAGLRDQRNDGPSRAASARLMASAVSIDPVKATPATRRIARPARRRRSSPAPGERRAARRPARPPRCRSAAARAATSGVCSAGFATTALPAASAALDLAGEDRQRKVPRADTREHAAPVPATSRFDSPAGPGKLQRSGEIRARLRRVVAQKVGRLPHFADRRRAARLAGFAHENATNQRRAAASSIASAARSRTTARAAPPGVSSRSAPGGGGCCDGATHVARADA